MDAAGVVRMAKTPGEADPRRRTTTGSLTVVIRIRFSANPDARSGHARRLLAHSERSEAEEAL